MTCGWGGFGRWVRVAGSMLVLLMVLNCSSNMPEPDDKTPWLPQGKQPTFVDDLDRASLQQALQRSLDYVQSLPPHASLPFGNRRISVTILRQTLEAFRRLIQHTSTPEALNAKLHEQFDVVQAAGRDGRGGVLFTGYYEALLEGSLSPTAEFTYPLYRAPSDLIKVDLALFHTRYAGERLIARYEHGRVLPYFTRREIDTDGRLRGRGLEFVWLRNAVEGFFLHVQGSGQVHLPDDRIVRVNYAASNGHPYRSIGRLLIDEERLAPEAVSLQGLRHYFRQHPGERTRVLNHNPRYIFFRQVAQGPRGSLNLVLVPGRSIATDHRLFPPAGLAFIQTQKPVLNARGEITAWQTFSRFVFNHDTGSAITGPGRVDLFWGSGTTAEIAAGHMQHLGNLYFLRKR